MKNKPYDYRGFSLSRLGEPRFRHALLLGGWLAYFALYFLTENLIPAERCHVIHCALDDRIPFNEGFVFFYVGWYFLVFGSLAWTFFFDVERLYRHRRIIGMVCTNLASIPQVFSLTQKHILIVFQFLPRYPSHLMDKHSNSIPFPFK